MPKNIVITGANRGIGLQLTKQYVNQGCHVYAVCRQASDELNQLTNVEVISGIDVTDSACLSDLASALQGIAIDVLINNAGILRNETLTDFNNQTIVEQFLVNALASLNVCQHLLANLSSGSKIALVTSRMGSIADNGSGGRYGYRMSKAALNAGAVSLAKDLAADGVAVGIYHPGYVQTDMTAGRGDIVPEQAAERIAGLIARLDMNNSGVFYHSNGDILPW
ncbi:SDR family oxidoreductase [Thalassotalea sp. Y01]|uniref:SDR family NAD(P)-dependent oxidoreductase n=1 Tax=Thalassotalea sp. Y01 TaxID=2729613 RepID=UPI00145D3ACB|nr:SDR family oxidoreductase [Thalassotalea sp. Y01]